MNNLLAWCLQVLIVAGAGAVLPWVFRLKAPRAKLWYWQVLLAACVVLPMVQPWVQPATTVSNVAFTTGQFRVASVAQTSSPQISWTTALVILLAAGTVLRLLLLGIGLLRLRRYRTTAAPLECAAEFEDLRRSIAPETEILLSGQITSPVTFGVWNAVVLLPTRFCDLGLAERRSIVCHELIHIRRRDWALTIAEELVRAILWFHPAVWWVLGQIQLTREQVVNEAVIQSTGDRDRYLDALLAIASLHLRADLAPAPLFLKKRHLRQRVESIVTGVTMNKRTLLIPLAAALATLPVVIGVAAWQFPLHAAEITDDPGVELQLGSARILHRTSIAFPVDAREKQLSGTVVVHVSVNDQGEVTGAQAVSGPDEFRTAVVQSVANWHFALDSSNPARTFEFSVRFDSGAPAPAAGLTRMNPSADEASRTVNSIDLSSLPAALRDRITQADILHTGAAIRGGKEGLNELIALNSELRVIDRHLRLNAMTRDGKTTLVVRLMPAAPTTPTSSSSIRVGGNIQSTKLINQPRPVYPPLAKQARIQGTVKFDAIIGPDGHIQNLAVISGHPMLVQAALEAVKLWVYEPTLLNGAPVSVSTVIDVNFTLSDGPPPPAGSAGFSNRKTGQPPASLPLP